MTKERYNMLLKYLNLIKKSKRENIKINKKEIKNKYIVYII